MKREKKIGIIKLTEMLLDSKASKLSNQCRITFLHYLPRYRNLLNVQSHKREKYTVSKKLISYLLSPVLIPLVPFPEHNTSSNTHIVESSSLTALKSPLIHLYPSSLSLAWPESPEMNRVKSQVGKSLKSDVSLMKSDIKGINGANEGDSVKAHTTAHHFELFLAAVESEKRESYNANRHITQGSSSSKSVGNRIKARRQSTEKTDRVAKDGTGKHSYLSKQTLGREKSEKILKTEQHRATSSETLYAPFLREPKPEKNARLEKGQAQAQNKSSNKPSKSNPSYNDKQGTIRQHLNTITLEGKLKVEGRNQKFTIISNALGKKEGWKGYPMLPFLHQAGGNLKSYATRGWSGSHKSKSKSSVSIRGKLANHGTVTRCCCIHNLTQRHIAKKLLLPASNEELIFTAEVGLKHSKLEKSTGVLERLNCKPTQQQRQRAQSSNMHSQVRTKTTTGPSSSTRNSCATSNKQACSSDSEGTIIGTPLSQPAKNSYERNKSNIENENDSLTASNWRCKRKCQTKQGLHFTIPGILKEKLVLKSANCGGFNSPAVSTWKSILSRSTRMPAKRPQNQLAKLDTLIGSPSFELEKASSGVYTKAKSDSSFDKSFDNVTATVSNSHTSKELSGLITFTLFSQYQQHLNPWNKDCQYCKYGAAAEPNSDFHQIIRYKRALLCAIKTNNSLKNFLQHGKRSSKKGMMSKFHTLLPNNNPTQMLSLKYIKQKFSKMAFARRKGILASPSFPLDFKLTGSSSTHDNIAGGLLNRNYSNSKTSKNLSVKGNVEYRLGFIRSSRESPKITVETQQLLSSEDVRNEIIREQNDRTESSGNPTSFMFSATIKPLPIFSKFSSFSVVPYKPSSLEHDTSKWKRSLARSSRGSRKWLANGNKTVQGKKGTNHKCFSRFSLVGLRNRSGGSRGGDLKAVVLIMPSKTLRNEPGIPEYLNKDDKSPHNNGSNNGKDVVTRDQIQNETRTSFTQLPYKRRARKPAEKSEQKEIETLFRYNVKIKRKKSHKRSKRDMGCVTWFSNRKLGDDGCGIGERRATLQRKNPSRKLILRKGDLLAPLTWDKSAISSAVNANNYSKIGYEKKLRESKDVGESKPLPTQPFISNFATNIQIDLQRFDETRSENEKIEMMLKAAKRRNKVWATNFNLPQKQSVNVNVNKGRNIYFKDFSLEGNNQTFANISTSQLSNPENSVSQTGRTRLKILVSPNYGDMSSQKLASMKVHGVDGVRQEASTTEKTAGVESLVSTNAPGMFEFSTFIASVSLDIQSTDGNTAVTVADSTSLSFSTSPQVIVMSGESSTRQTTVNTMKNDISTGNEEINADLTPTATTPSKYYVPSAPTTPAQTATAAFTSSLSTAVPTQKPKTDVGATTNSINLSTTEASSRSNTEELKATIGFTEEKTIPSTGPPIDAASSTMLIDESETDATKLTTTTSSSVDTALHHSSTFTSGVATTTSATSPITSNPFTTINSEDVDFHTSTIFPMSATSTVASTQVNTFLTDFEILSTMSTSEVTTASVAVTSQKDILPTEIASAHYTVITSTNPLLGTTLMSTMTASLEDANVRSTTIRSTIMSSESSPNSKSTVEVEGNAQEKIPSTTSFPITTVLISTTSNSSLEVEKMQENEAGSTPTTTVSPPKCDQNAGMEYSEESKNCVCKPGRTYGHHSKKCINLIGNECFGDGEASNSECPLNSLCKPQEESAEQKGICACVPGYIPAADKSRCLAGWNSDCTAAATLDITINQQCHPDFDCVSQLQESRGKCVCKDKRTVGLPYFLERNKGNGTGSWGNEQQIQCFLDYGSDCDPSNDECNDFRFLKCSRQNAKCECADANSQLYDERTHECVARAGTFCAVNLNQVDPTGINGGNYEMKGGFLACIGNSTCTHVGNETNSQGTCKCVDGYNQHWQGYCTMKGSGSTMRNNGEMQRLFHLVWLMLLKNLII